MSVPHQQVGALFTTSSAAPIVSLSLSGTLNYLDPSTSKPIRAISGHQKAINAMGTTKDHKTIFTGSYDGRICAWDVAIGDAEVISDDGGGLVQFTSSDKAAWSISQDDVLKDIDLEKLSLGYSIFHSNSNNSGLSGTGSTPKGLAVQNGETVFVATIKDIQILQNGKKLVQESTKFTPSAIAVNPAVSGEFAVGAEVTLLYTCSC
jgi:WD repeat-containing protein 1 (actin-interacting protein 1)